MSKTLDSSDNALKFAMKLIGLRRRSEMEIRQRLEEKGTDESLAQEVIDELYRYRYLDDEAFAESYINDRVNFRPAGRFALKNELMKRGISSEIIDRKLSQLLDKEKEIAIAENLARKKLRSSTKNDPKRIRGKLIFHLRSRGFASDIIGQAINNALESDKIINDENE